jgi:glycosyltransferase involved in cell wall biosynthesis
MTGTAQVQTPPPRFSVVMPAFNAERTIAQSIGCVVAQTYADWELIVIDDGSSDDTPRIVESTGDIRVRLLGQPASGLPAVARNPREVRRIP